MRNLHEVVNFSAAADNCFSKTRPVNSYIGPNFYIIMNFY